MPRRPRDLEDNVVYHIYNRRTDKQCLFDSDMSYQQFVDLLRAANDKYPVRLHAFCLMRTHWHLALSAERAQFLTKHVGWVSARHAAALRRDTKTLGQGHIYQGRFQSIAVVGIVHYVRLIRYIESNPQTAGLVTRAEDWPWSSLPFRVDASCSLIQPGPWQLPSDWIDVVNAADINIELLPELLGQRAAFSPTPIAFH
jgi:putative transposase